MKEGTEWGRRAGAFFDVDGTLVPGPSLELRVFRGLRSNAAIPLLNYARWGREAVHLLPRGLNTIVQGNKYYLHGVRVEQILAAVESITFFEEGIARVEWHARRGHEVVLVTGMMKPVAMAVALALECELEARGVAREVLVSATKVEEKNGRLTGRLIGEANYGEAKRQAVLRIARVMEIDLVASHAYGNSLHDTAMLRTVGHAHAVNPGKVFAGVANEDNWAIWHWHQEKRSSLQETPKSKGKLQMIGTRP